MSSGELVEHLVTVASSKNRAAFSILFAYYSPRLMSYFSQFGTTRGAAEDLAQDTMLRIWTNAASFDPEKGSPSTWVFTIARNVRASKLRGKHNALREATSSEFEELEDPEPRPDDVLAQRDVEKRLHQVLESIPHGRAILIKAAFFDDKTHLEIAQERKMPIGTVKSHLRRTLIKLRRGLT